MQYSILLLHSVLFWANLVFWARTWTCIVLQRKHCMNMWTFWKYCPSYWNIFFFCFPYLFLELTFFGPSKNLDIHLEMVCSTTVLNVHIAFYSYVYSGNFLISNIGYIFAHWFIEPGFFYSASGLIATFPKVTVTFNQNRRTGSSIGIAS